MWRLRLRERNLNQLNVSQTLLRWVLVLGLAIFVSSQFLSWQGNPPAWAVSTPVSALGSKSTEIDFNLDIRPILSDRCFSCHGPDSAKRQSGFRIDQQTAAFAPLPSHKSKHAFIAGDPDHSYAYLRMISSDPQEVMPPSTSHLAKLTPSEAELVRRWIIQGAHWKEHWAFIKPVRYDPPPVQDTSWPKNEIDRFVLARLEQEGLHPSAPADKATLIRRVSLDLTGIPPTPGQVDAFIADTSPQAYEKVVDRLLASPHYGEQMAVQWLDYARYADSHGFQSDSERHMSAWRDWVINAYNSNMPFNEFTIEQLAGDLLPNATMDQKIATGFNRNHRHNSEGGIIAEEWRIENVIDRTSTTSAVFLGLTMECCRCHDHKFDPITQKEFYQVSAYFNSIDETGGMRDRENVDSGINALPILKLTTPEQQAKLDALQAKMTASENDREEIEKTFPKRDSSWEAAGAKVRYPAGLTAEYLLDESLAGRDASGQDANATTIPAATSTDAPEFTDVPGGHAVHIHTAGGAINVGPNFSFDRTDARSFEIWVRARGNGEVITCGDPKHGGRGFDLSVDHDRLVASLVHHAPDNLIRIRTRQLERNKWLHVTLTYDGSSKAAGLKIYIDGKPAETEIQNDTLSDSIKVDAPLILGKSLGSSAFDVDLRDFCLFNRALRPFDVEVETDRVFYADILKIPAAQRSDDQKKQLARYVGLSDPDAAAAEATADQAKYAFDSLNNQLPDTQVMRDLPKPRDTFVLIRGQYDKPGEKVEPGTPSVLPPLPPDAPKNRLGLARWIVDPGNPLTPRVLVNRLWEKFFGIGLVKTSENFGTQGDPPSHPELLDWLATELIRLNWDMKAIQKEIVMSAAYQQDSTLNPDILERDPENRLISHGPRFRLMGETIRDQALAVSGLLNEKIGGRSVRPYEPLNLWDGNLYGNLAKYTLDTTDNLYRRSIYTFIKRTAAPPNLTLFDMPNREYCVIRRPRTDTPLQALDLLNDPTYIEAARVLAEHAMKEGGAAPADRIAYAFRRATCRMPTSQEIQILLDGFNKRLQEFQQNAPAATKLIAVGATPADPKLNPSELAAYTMTCRIVLNLDEMVTRQ